MTSPFLNFSEEHVVGFVAVRAASSPVLHVVVLVAGLAVAHLVVLHALCIGSMLVETPPGIRFEPGMRHGAETC